MGAVVLWVSGMPALLLTTADCGHLQGWGGGAYFRAVIISPVKFLEGKFSPPSQIPKLTLPHAHTALPKPPGFAREKHRHLPERRNFTTKLSRPPRAFPCQRWQASLGHSQTVKFGGLLSAADIGNSTQGPGIPGHQSTLSVLFFEECAACAMDQAAPDGSVLRLRPLESAGRGWR